MILMSRRHRHAAVINVYNVYNVTNLYNLYNLYNVYNLYNLYNVYNVYNVRPLWGFEGAFFEGSSVPRCRESGGRRPLGCGGRVPGFRLQS